MFCINFRRLIKLHGRAEIDIKRAAIKLAVLISKSSDGHPVLKVTNCEPTIPSLSLHLHGKGRSVVYTIALNSYHYVLVVGYTKYSKVKLKSLWKRNFYLCCVRRLMMLKRNGMPKLLCILVSELKTCLVFFCEALWRYTMQPKYVAFVYYVFKICSVIWSLNPKRQLLQVLKQWITMNKEVHNKCKCLGNSASNKFAKVNVDIV